MTIATTNNSAAQRIVEALGLRNVRSLKIDMRVNAPVVIITEQFATTDQIERVAAALETKQWVLVAKSDWDRLTNAQG